MLRGCVFLEFECPFSACYGIPQHSSSIQWLCQRCLAGVSHNQDCCLCLLRGGALKPTDGGRWAHLVCAVTIPDVYLGDLQNKEPVVTEKITRARRKLVSNGMPKLMAKFSVRLALLTVCLHV